jgi:homoisocitrate dehydrogenase
MFKGVAKLLSAGTQLKNFRIAIIPGDGIGQEVIPWGKKCLEAIHMYSPAKFSYVDLEAGYDCFLKSGTAIPDKTIQEMTKCDGTLFGAAATPSPAPYGYTSPILDFRRRFDLYANLRPMKSVPVDTAAARSNVDMEVVRENTECLYIGRERYELMSADKTAVAERQVSELASLRIAKVAFELARTRAKRRAYSSPHVSMVHKANIMPLSEGVFRDAFFKVANDFPDVIYDEHLLDSFMYKITMHPQDFDVVLAPNTWGNIISNAYAPMVGGLGMVEGLNVGDKYVVGEPVHGAPASMAGLGIANPIAAMRAAVAIATHLAKGPDFSDLLNQAINATLMEAKHLTPDLGGNAKGAELGEQVARRFAQVMESHFSS